jgi:hypothetical protein
MAVVVVLVLLGRTPGMTPDIFCYSFNRAEAHVHSVCGIVSTATILCDLNQQAHSYRQGDRLSKHMASEPRDTGLGNFLAPLSSGRTHNVVHGGTRPFYREVFI